jgi:hypothetical protein
VPKLAAGADTPQELPFTGLGDPQGLTVDSHGNVYVVDTAYGHVFKMRQST